MDEPALIRAARRGDLDAFNQLVVAYQGRIYNLAYRLIGETEAAADAAQDTFIRAWNELHTFKDGSFGAWLSRIATNRSYDELRRVKRRPVTSLDTPEGEIRFVSDTESPEQAAQRSEMNRAIQGCLDALPDDQRTAAVLSDVQGYDYQEIATAMNVPIGTVRSRLSRARTRLRDCLATWRELLPDTYRQEGS
jgi:RNA polymerase sigma-70 factor, ECF subfamily